MAAGPASGARRDVDGPGTSTDLDWGADGRRAGSGDAEAAVVVRLAALPSWGSPSHRAMGTLPGPIQRGSHAAATLSWRIVWSRLKSRSILPPIQP